MVVGLRAGVQGGGHLAVPNFRCAMILSMMIDSVVITTAGITPSIARTAAGGVLPCRRT